MNTGPEKEIAEIVDFYDRWRDFCNNRFVINAEEGLSFYCDFDGVRMFDINRMQASGKAFRDHYMEMGPMYADAQLDYIDREIHASAEMAYISMFEHYRGSDKLGNSFDFMLRVTDCLKKIQGEWLFAHEHFSFPVDMSTGIAMFKGEP